ncbi:Clp protease N-terminal domain-containing protein [Catenulispora sp. GAS73]|uniref:Clp protease N-terminal domain-containing protein n=1 Tax=Catenulispora sp. GAS73 TaxID=3156269 RepID=UPI003514628C
MPELPDLSSLIAELDARTAADSDPGDLHRLAAAEEIADELTALGARLVGYYVEQARARGNSWADIGGHLGISRQAAQQRYAPARFQLTVGDLIATGALDRLTDRTRATLVRAEQHATRLGSGVVEPGHVLLAMLDDEDTLAVQALERLEVDTAGIRHALQGTVLQGTQTPAPPRLVSTPLGTPARRLLETALVQALKLNHNYIGTEHLLLALAHTPDDPAAQLLADRGVTYDRAREAVQAVIDEYLRRR